MSAATSSAAGLATACALFTGLLLPAAPAGAATPAGSTGATAGAQQGRFTGAVPNAADARLREVIYDPQAVVTVPVKRGIVTLVLLDADESITELASGLGGDCAKPDAAWCVTAQPGGRTVFVKPRSSATAANNLAIVTTRRIHNLRLLVLGDNDPRPPVYRLAVRAPASVPPDNVRAQASAQQRAKPQAQAQLPPDSPANEPNPTQPRIVPLPTPEQLVSERLQAKPAVTNTQYSLAEGADSQDIVPTLVFDDGRFTYLRFPGNREVPAVFQVLGDGSEAIVNARIEDDLLVVDRVSRRLMLRAGAAVVGLWNEAFDIEGTPTDQGTTVPGVRRILKSAQVQSADLTLPGLQSPHPGSRSALDGGAP